MNTGNEEIEIVPKPGIDPEAMAQYIRQGRGVRQCTVQRGAIRITYDASRISAKKLMKYVARFRSDEGRPVKKNVVKVRNIKTEI